MCSSHFGTLGLAATEQSSRPSRLPETLLREGAWKGKVKKLLSVNVGLPSPQLGSPEAVGVESGQQYQHALYTLAPTRLCFAWGPMLCGRLITFCII